MRLPLKIGRRFSPAPRTSLNTPSSCSWTRNNPKPNNETPLHHPRNRGRWQSRHLRRVFQGLDRFTRERRLPFRLIRLLSRMRQDPIGQHQTIPGREPYSGLVPEESELCGMGPEIAGRRQSDHNYALRNEGRTLIYNPIGYRTLRSCGM